MTVVAGTELDAGLQPRSGVSVVVTIRPGNAHRRSDGADLAAAVKTVTDGSGAWSVTLTPNDPHTLDDVDPAGSYYVVERTDRAANTVDRDPIVVPNAGGTVLWSTCLIDWPSSGPSSALQHHLDDPVDAHDAVAISLAAISGVAATNVQAAIAEMYSSPPGVDGGGPASVYGGSDPIDAGGP